MEDCLHTLLGNNMNDSKLEGLEKKKEKFININK